MGKVWGVLEFAVPVAQATDVEGHILWLLEV